MTTASHDRSLLLLLALVTALTAELVRASGPLLDHAFTQGVDAAATAALVTYLAPAVVVAALVARRGVTGRVVVVAVGVLLAARLALQALGGAIAARELATDLGAVRYHGGLATVALSLAALILVAAFAGAPPHRDDGGTGAGSTATRTERGPDDGGTGAAQVRGLLVARGITLGLLGAAAVSLLFGTWDAVWRHDAAGWLYTVVLVGATGATAWPLRRLGPAAGVRGLWVLGPFLALGVQVWANPAFVAATTGLPLVAATAGIGMAALATGIALSWHRPTGTLGRPLTAAVAVVAGIWVLFLAVPRLDDPPTAWAWCLLAVATLLPAVGARALAGALTRPVRGIERWRLVATTAATGLGTVLPLLVYQLDFDVPLPFPAGLIPVVTAVCLVLGAAVGARRLAPPPVSRRTRLTGALLTGTVATLAGIAAVATALSGPSSSGPSSGSGDAASRDADELTVMSWNVHYGVSSDPSVRLDEMVRVLDDSAADVVALQEVSRGWVLGGGADMLTHLADATGRELAWAPAADRRFGNALLWDPARVQVTDVARVALPYGEGPQDRSALAATVTTSGGVAVRVVTTHLQHREENHATRLEQLDALFAAEPVDGPYVLLGDLNAEPGWAEIAAITDRGLVSGQDDVGDPAGLTSPAVDPRYRVDWVLATADLPFETFTILDVVPADHRPLVATVTLP